MSQNWTYFNPPAKYEFLLSTNIPLRSFSYPFIQRAHIGNEDSIHSFPPLVLAYLRSILQKVVEVIHPGTFTVTLDDFMSTIL